MFRVLPGLEYIGNDMNKHLGANAKYQSKKGPSQVTGMEKYGDMVIIGNSNQFVPYCVLHFESGIRKK